MNRDQDASVPRHDAITTPTTPQPSARPAVSVIVCAFTEDRWEDLSRAVDSLHRQTEQPREVIVVIDHCPGLLHRAQRDLAGVTVLPNRFGKGLSGGRNTGAMADGGDVIAFLDDDAAADPGWIAAICDRYQDPRVLGVGGLVKPDWDTGRPSWFPPELDWVVGCSYRGLPEASAPVRNFIGANMSFRREVLDQLGGFSDGLGRVDAIPLGCEETELCLRASQRPTPRESSSTNLPPPSRTGCAPTVRAGPTCVLGATRRDCRRPPSRSWLASRRALASERSYVQSVIPRALVMALTGAARGHQGGPDDRAGSHRGGRDHRNRLCRGQALALPRQLDLPSGTVHRPGAYADWNPRFWLLKAVSSVLNATS